MRSVGCSTPQVISQESFHHLSDSTRKVFSLMSKTVADIASLSSFGTLDSCGDFLVSQCDFFGALDWTSNLQRPCHLGSVSDLCFNSMLSSASTHSVLSFYHECIDEFFQQATQQVLPITEGSNESSNRGLHRLG